jgi:hypothetical protein
MLTLPMPRCSAGRAECEAPRRTRRRSAWRALAPGGDIGDPEVAHRVYPGALRDHRGLADLQRRMRRRVPDRLPVRSHRADLAGREPRLRDRIARRLGEPTPEVEVHAAVVARPRLVHDNAQLAPLVVAVRMLHVGEQLGTVSRLLGVEARHDGGDAVERRPGHEADVGERHRAYSFTAPVIPDT